MNCRHAQRHLQLLMDGCLGRAESARVEQHLQRCTACSQELQRLAELDVTLAAEPELDPPEHLRHRIVSEALSQSARTRSVLLPVWLEALTFSGTALAVIALGLWARHLAGQSFVVPLGLSSTGLLASVVAGVLSGLGSIYYRSPA